MVRTLTLITPFFLLSVSCTAESTPFPETSASDVDSYWFDKAEITRYELKQSRYGEMRIGESVLIFVTEPFLKDKQVKHEFGPDDQATPVLKLNRIRSFPTGVYDYRMMASVFHPLKSNKSSPSDLKIAMSSTEWCGLMFQQVNRREGELTVEIRSYFQNAGDQNLTLPSVWTEDGLWTQLRLDPSSLPTGSIEIFPELFFQRLQHLKPEVQTAKASIDMNSDISTYTLDYPSLKRVLEIRFEKRFPHRILGWRETVDGEVFTEAKATHSEMLYYWERNTTDDSFLRGRLGL